MTPREYITWLRGFAQASNTYNITPKQWDTICEELSKVIEDVAYTVPVDTRGATNTTADIRNNTVTYDTYSSTDTLF